MGKDVDIARMLEHACRGFAEGLLRGIVDSGSRAVHGGCDTGVGGGQDVDASEAGPWYASPGDRAGVPDPEELSRIASGLTHAVPPGYADPLAEREFPHQWGE
jgi:hypothetical protein